MSREHTEQLLLTAMFAAIICLGTFFFRFPVPPAMVHMGNALVVVSFLALGTKYSMIAAAIGFGLFDLLSGYASSIPVTIVESLIVLSLLGLLYRYRGETDTLKNVILLSIVAGVSKFIIIFIRRLIEMFLLVGNETAISLATIKMTNSLITSLVTIIAAPILYFALKKYVPRLFVLRQ